MSINGHNSSPVNINFSVPQGSINGPIYFTCYSSTLKTCVPPKIQLVGYADDHTIYSGYRAGDTVDDDALSRISQTLTDTKDWMLQNRLKMNDEKTEFIVFGSRQSLAKCNVSEIVVGDCLVSRSSVVTLLGVEIDENLNFKQHITSKARTAALSMFNLKKLRRHLDRRNCLKIANALIFSHMDYANSVFINLPKVTMHPFQRIQNMTAKVILGVSKFSSTTEALKELHFLPVSVRCEYKLLVLVFKCLHNLAPNYLIDLIRVKDYSYKTKRSQSVLLKVPLSRNKCFADRSFSVAGPSCWEKLPSDIRSIESLGIFKKKLKTFLFQRTFAC